MVNPELTEGITYLAWECLKIPPGGIGKGCWGEVRLKYLWMDIRHFLTINAVFTSCHGIANIHISIFSEYVLVHGGLHV